MKKIIYSAAALSLAFFAASCQQENLEPVETGSNTVTYSVQVPGAIATKANPGSVAGVTELVYEVYRLDASGEIASLAYEDVVTLQNNETKWDLELEFVKDQKFQVLFWAQKPNVGAYNTGDLRQVSLNSATLTANVDDYAAFAGYDYVTNCVSHKEGKVTLVRPISQIQVGTDAAGLVLGTEGSNKVNISLTSSSMLVKGLPTSYNVANGEVSETEQNVEYTVHAVPAGTFTANSKEYTYVAQNYVAFADEMGTTVEVDFTVTTSEGDVQHTVSNVPLKPNYRTNIIGNLITENADYSIDLEADWEDEENNVEFVTVSNAGDLQDAIDNIKDGNEGNIKLEGNIDLGSLAGLVSTKANHDPAYGLLIPAGKSLVLDLNGCTLAQIVECTGTYSMIQNLGNLTVIDSKGTGKISFKDTSAGDPSFGWGSYTISNNGTLVVNGGTIEHTGEQNTPGSVVHMYCAIQQNNDNAVTTVNGGSVKNSTYRSIRICSGTANINGGDMIGQVWVQPFAERIALNIAGGNFQPSGADGSSVFVTNNAKDVALAVTGGYFATKIGASVPANLAGSVIGGTYASSAKENTPADLYAGYMFVQDGENYILEECPVKVGESAYYATLAEAVKAVKEGETITIRAGKTLEEGTVKLPSTLKDVTFVGEEGATLKGMTVSATDGNSYNYEGLTFNGITFDNSRILLTGWRNGDETIKNLTVTNCIFKNLYDTTNSAPLHINKDAAEAVNGFVFTNNVIDGATGGSKSGIYAQLTGDILVSGNFINNVSFRPFVIQVTTDDSVADNFVVTNNTFSGSASGRAQGLGNNSNGTDAVNVVVTENIFKGITDSQQICYWNFNPATTTADLSHNYYDIDILANPGKIYFNNSAANVYDLVDMSIFPIYTDENKTKPFSPEVNAAKIGETEYATLQEAFNVGGEITLLCNLTVAETVVLAEGKTVVLNLNGKTLDAADKNVIKNNGGNLTIKNGTITRTGDAVGYSVNNASGEIAVENATIERGLYTSGSKMTATNANISHEQSSRHAIYAWNCEVTINSGTFHNDNAGNATLMASGSSVVTINGGTFSIADGRSSLGWTSSMIDQNSTAQVLVKGGLFNGGFRINSADTKLTIEGGEFNTNNGSAFTDNSGTKVVKGGKFTDAGAQNWAKKYLADGYILAGDEVKKAYVVNDAASLIETITNAEAGAYIVVEDALECSETVSLPANSTLEIKADAHIKTLKAVNGGKILIQDGKTLTLNNFSFGAASTAGSKYEIKGGTVVASYGFFQHGEYALYSNFETGYMYYSYGSDITVYGTFHSQGEGDGLDYVRGKLTIAKGGKSIHDKSLWVGQPASWGEMSASLTIENGGYLQAKTLSVYAGSSMTYSNDADMNCGWGDKTGAITKK